MNKIPLFTSCARYTGGIIGGNPTGDYIEIVKFNDPTLLNKVVCVALEEGQTAPEAGNQFFRGGEYFIPTCFEQTPGEPLFCVEEQPSFFAPKMRYQYGNNYDLCDLASKRKYIALENGWYLCYPYAGLSQCHRYLNVDWADICNVSLWHWIMRTIQKRWCIITCLKSKSHRLPRKQRRISIRASANK